MKDFLQMYNELTTELSKWAPPPSRTAIKSPEELHLRPSGTTKNCSNCIMYEASGSFSDPSRKCMLLQMPVSAKLICDAYEVVNGPADQEPREQSRSRIAYQSNNQRSQRTSNQTTSSTTGTGAVLPKVAPPIVPDVRRPIS